jgi:hypothetical protein
MKPQSNNSTKNMNNDLRLKGEEGKAFIAGDFSKLRQDNVYVPNELIPIKDLTGYEGKKGYEFGLVSNGKLVNVVSDGYGHLSNENFFLKVEEKLINSDINYLQRSVNRNDCSFAVDYILNDKNIITEIKTDNIHAKMGDKIRPMLRFVNSYDGSNKKSGYFGFFREVCANGLHMAQTNIGFSIKARGANMEELIMPEIHTLLNKFMNNEYYTLVRKFEVMAEKSIPHDMIGEFVRMVCDKTQIFKYEASEKNPNEPSLNARLVIDTMKAESSLLGVNANYWLGYNAFNEVLHDKLKKSFELQKTKDIQLFEYLAN